jgi:hypothetical protein
MYTKVCPLSKVQYQIKTKYYSDIKQHFLPFFLICSFVVMNMLVVSDKLIYSFEGAKPFTDSPFILHFMR